MDYHQLLIDVYWRSLFLTSIVAVSVEPVVNPVPPEEVAVSELARAERALREIENRVADASLQV